MKKNTWTTVTRNLQKDLEDYEPNNKIISISSFSVRNNGKVELDNIKVFNSKDFDNNIKEIKIDKQKEEKKEEKKEEEKSAEEAVQGLSALFGWMIKKLKSY